MIPVADDTFDELFRREFPRLVRALAVSEGVEDAADAVQEAFVAALRRWPKVRTLDDPAGWVRRAAINRLLNGARNRRRRQTILNSLTPKSTSELGELDLDLMHAIRRLPRAQRLAVCLHHVGGLTVNEVSELLGIAPGTVKSNLFDARGALHRQLEVIE